MKTLSLIFISMIISLSQQGSAMIIPAKPMIPYNSVSEILQTIDPKKLPQSIEPIEGEFQSDYIQILTQKATDIRNYISAKYAEDLSHLSNEEIIVLGMGIVPFETRETFPGYMTNEEIFKCFIKAIGVVGGIYGMVQSFITLWNSGAGVGTLLSTVKNIFKISGGWFMVGYSVYQFGDCVGWW